MPTPIRHAQPWLRTSLALTAIALPGMLASACGTQGPDISRGFVDRDHIQIELPADAYGMTWQEADKVRHARDVATDKCMREQGLRNWNVDAYSPEAPAMPDWRYGRWNAEYVAQYGVMGKPWPQGAEARAKNDKMIEKNPKAPNMLAECDRKTGLVVIDGETEVQGAAPNPVFIANQESYDKVYADSRAKAVWKEVGVCTEKAGFAVVYEDGYPGLEYSDGWTEEQTLKAEVAKARCADQVNATQRIADIEAGYQQKYIAEHEAEFVAVRAEVDKMLAKADEIIKNNG